MAKLIIVPTRFKDIFRRNYFPLYTAFLRSLGVSDLSIVIGHSLRDEYLLAAIRDRLRDRDFRLIIVNPSFPAKADLAGGARRLEEQVVHLDARVENIQGLLDQLADGRSAAEAFDLARAAASSSIEGDRPSVEIDGIRPWMEGGASHTVKISVKTRGVPIRVDARIEINKQPTDSIALNGPLQTALGGEPVIRSFNRRSFVIRPYFRKSMGRGPHSFSVRLTGSDGKAQAVETSSFRLKGV